MKLLRAPEKVKILYCIRREFGKRYLKSSPQNLLPLDQNPALPSRHYMYPCSPDTYPWIARDDSLPLLATNTVQLTPLQPDTWPGPPCQTNSFLLLPYNPVQHHPLHPQILRFFFFLPWLFIYLLFYFPLLVLALLFFHPVDQFQLHQLFKTLACLTILLFQVPHYRVLCFDLHQLTSNDLRQVLPALETGVILYVCWARGK